MTTKTKNAVVEILTVAADALSEGRPRKPLGKARPKVDARGRLSTYEALRQAAKQLGHTKHAFAETLFHTRMEILERVYHRQLGTSYASSDKSVVEAFDERELDTRTIQRVLRAAAQYVGA